MEKWFPNLLNSLIAEDYKYDKPLNDYFNQNGFESKLFIKNIGSALIFLIIYVTIWLATFILMLFG